MKKLLSILLVAVMVVSMCAVATFSGSAATPPSPLTSATLANVKKGDVLKYDYYLQCSKKIMSIQCETEYSSNLKPVTNLDEYNDDDVTTMYPKLTTGVVYNFAVSPILFNYVNVNGANFKSKGVIMSIYFIATADGTASINTNMRILQDVDSKLLIEDFTTKEGAEFEFTSSLTKPATPPEVKLIGDVDSNGTINVNDASYVQKQAASISLPKFDASVADVDMNGLVNINDASYLQKYAASIELPNTIRVGQYVTYTV